MKAILKFDLSDQDDIIRFNTVNNASKYATTLDTIWQKFRSLEKYDDRADMPIEEARQAVIDCFAENNLSIDDLF